MVNDSDSFNRFDRFAHSRLFLFPSLPGVIPASFNTFNHLLLRTGARSRGADQQWNGWKRRPLSL